jgi:spore maturation protein CgeB
VECKEKWNGKKQNFSEASLDDAIQAHEPGRVLNLIKKILVFFGVFIFGKRRGLRAARRLVFELSWRFCGKKTFSASGWPGRMFPEQ